MGLFNIGRSKDEILAEQEAKLQKLESESRLRGAQMEELHELVRHLDEDRYLLMGALKVLRPGMDPKALGTALLDLSFKPLGLASFYMALVDWENSLLHFPLYHEGGRARNHTPRSLKGDGGLTGRTVDQGRPLYLRSLEESMSAGAILSEAEKGSGLVPQSWYGVPIGSDPAWGGRPFGLLSFQSFQKDAFSESRRNLMDALGSIMAFTLKADPARRLTEAGP
ncbi:MAG TPA: GAF domain-containing protein [Holophagaceae bacterium]|nr:GAF domain-containing protein [Holophagaceae bacterium]